ncbi:MAG: hypothetical protein ABID38_02325 [Candidatus Diapherotrites archaeon]
MILATPTSTQMKVIDVDNPKNLQVEFSDSLRSDDDFVFYEFRLNAQEPVTLKKLTLSEEGEQETKELDASLGKYGSAIISPADNKPKQNQGALISGPQMITARETFRHEYDLEETFLIAELTDEYMLNADYEFEEGTVNVKYLFTDKEIHAFWFFFRAIPIFVSIILTALFAIILFRK